MVALLVDYNVSIPLLGKMVEIAVKTMNERELKLLLSNLRTRFAFPNIIDNVTH